MNRRVTESGKLGSGGAVVILVILRMLAVIAAAEPPSGYELVFSDEFNGTALDNTKWAVTNYWSNMSHEAWLLPKNAVVEDGVLKLILKRESVNGSKYTTAYIMPKTFRVQFGYFEIRCKIPHGNGLIPAFWAQSSWECCNNGRRIMEFDFVEWWGSNHYKVIGPTLHWQHPRETASHHYRVNVDLTKDFHVYGTLWTADNAINSWFDGIEKGGPKPFHTGEDWEEMRMMICLQSPWGWGPDIDETTPLPATFEVDYVRVYQKRKTIGPTGVPIRVP